MQRFNHLSLVASESGKITRGVMLLLLCLLPTVSWAAKCLFVSSYHQGYAWSDGIQQGLHDTLAGECDLRQFDMDTKRKKRKEEKEYAALQAKAIIEEWQPDVVITADDNAARYLIVPYYKDATLPFVFCGINWSTAEYGFPYSNVTGMVEVAPINAMLTKTLQLIPTAKRAFYLGADTETEKKNANRLQMVVESKDLRMERALVGSVEAWMKAYQKGQDYDFLIIGSRAGIQSWHDDEIRGLIEPLTRKLSVTSHGWMMPVSVLGMTKVPQEQGIWAAKVALKILGGVSPNAIPIITNRKWDLWLNEALLASTRIQLPVAITLKAKKWSMK